MSLPPHSILEAVGRLALLHIGWLQRSDVSTWSTDAIAAALLERLRGAGLATQSGNGTLASDDSSKPNAVSTGGSGGVAPSMQQKWMVCAASTEHNTQLPILEASAQITIRSARSRWRSQVSIRSNSCLRTIRRQQRGKQRTQQC